MIVDASLPDSIGLLDRAVLMFEGEERSAADFVAANNTLAFIDMDRDELVGWCWGYLLRRPDGRAMAYLHELEVAEPHRRQGNGTALVRAFASAASIAGAFKMFLTTGEANQSARLLYDSLGGSLAEQGPTVNYWFDLPLT